MSEIFISYARSTDAEADRVAGALSALGYQVWRDDQLPAHRAYSDVIDEHLRSAKAVLALWSKDAAASQWVRAEADVARLAGKLVQAVIDRTVPPLPFNQIHCADLTGWSGDPDNEAWRTLLASLAELTGGPAAADLGEGKARSRRRRAAASGGADDRARFAERSALALPDRPSIAVLPFHNLSGDPEQEYFADAITEDIVTALSRWRWFFVIARNTSFTYRSGADVQQVGRELGVRYVLEGSVRRIGGRVRVSAQLVEAASASTVWADRFDRDLTDLLALQDEITEQVVAAIEPAMLQSEGARSTHRSLADLTALDYFQRGMWHLNKVSREGYGEALSLFRQAVKRDPELSLGHIGLARILYGGAVYGWSATPVPDLREARSAAQTAIKLDPRDAYGHFAESGAALYLGEHDAASDAARLAVSLNPNFAFGHYRLGQTLLFGGRPAEAIAPIERALRYSPYDPQLGPMTGSLALAHYHARDYEAAAVQARSALSRGHANAGEVLAASLARLGRKDEIAKAAPASLVRRSGAPRLLNAPYANADDEEHLREGRLLAGLKPPD